MNIGSLQKALKRMVKPVPNITSKGKEAFLNPA